MELKSAIYEGTVRHRRASPVEHAFEQPLFQVYVDLAELDRVFSDSAFWSVDRPNLAWLRRKDYFGPVDRPIDVAVRDHVQASLGARPLGPIRMLTHARSFGMTMNPVTFYFGFEEGGDELAYVLAEITNTPWDERHAYLLSVRDARRTAAGLEWTFEKEFHVSPFMALERTYRWTFSTPGESLRIHMDVSAGDAKEFDATLRLRRRPLDAESLHRCLAAYPMLTLRVAAAIYAHAARLAWKGARFHPHPRRLRRSPA